MSLTHWFETHVPTRRPHRVKVRHYRKYVLLLAAAPLGALLHAGFLALFWWLELPWLAAANVASVALWGAAYAANQRGRHTLAVGLVGGEAAAHALLSTWWLGPAAGFHYYLWPVACLVIMAPRMRARFAAPCGLSVLGLYILLETTLPGRSPPGLATAPLGTLGVINMTLAALCLVIMAVILRGINALQERHLTRLATRDALTGLYNRHFATDFLSQLTERSRRNGESCTLVLADVDHFKRINDRHGHEVGDACLVRVADQLRAQFRASDCLCRWGGEEFLIVLPSTAPDRSHRILARFVRALEAAPVTTSHGPIDLTMSFGATEMAPGEAFEIAIDRADRLLYRAKDEGRNRIVSDAAPGRGAGGARPAATQVR